MISENPNLRTIPEIFKANVLLLNHPRTISRRVVDPYVWVTCLVVVIKQALHPSTTIAVAQPGHVRLVYALTLQPLGAPWFQGVNLFEDRSYPHLKLHSSVAVVPDPGAESRRLGVVSAPVEAAAERENA